MNVRGKLAVLLRFGFAVLLVFYTIPSRHASATGQLSPRSLTLQSSGVDGLDADSIVDGASQPSGIANHYFQFTVATHAFIGSVKFEYCTTANPSTACTTPSGLDTTAAGITFDETGSGATGFTLVNTSQPNGKPYITRTAADVTAGTILKFKLLGITNPDTTICYQSSADPAARNNCTFFVRITTYSSVTPTGGSEDDQGTVAASTATQINLTGYMPESLVFCTGGNISTTLANVPDCDTATSGNLTFPDFSPSATSYITSKMAASTNAQSGYTITVSGATLTSGSNTISAVSGAPGDTCKQGTSQFALNLVQNTNFCGSTGTTVGANITAAGGGVYKGEPLSPYNTDGTYRFDASGLNNIADSGSGGLGGTDAQIYTVTYIVNVPGSQPAGTYTTTLTYICTPTY